jgi:hypothetical protein
MRVIKTWQMEHCTKREVGLLRDRPRQLAARRSVIVDALAADNPIPPEETRAICDEGSGLSTCDS